MATDILVVESNSAPTTNNLTMWPVYAKKADLLRDLYAALGGEDVAITVIMGRLSNTDTSTWTDKGSRLA